MSEKITLHYNDAINSTFIIETEGEHELTNGFLKVTDVDDEENLVRINYFDLCDVTRVEVVHYLPDSVKAVKVSRTKIEPTED